MITLTNLDQLATLPVSAPVRTFLHDQLITQPFGTLEAAQAAWQPLDNRLIILDPLDDCNVQKLIRRPSPLKNTTKSPFCTYTFLNPIGRKQQQTRCDSQ